jgi:hypothetical protein
MLRMSLRMFVFALVLACGLTLWVAWEVLTPPTTTAAVQAQSTDNTLQVSVTRVVDGDTIEVSPQVEGSARRTPHRRRYPRGLRGRSTTLRSRGLRLHYGAPRRPRRDTGV